MRCKASDANFSKLCKGLKKSVKRYLAKKIFLSPFDSQLTSPGEGNPEAGKPGGIKAEFIYLVR